MRYVIVYACDLLDRIDKDISESKNEILFSDLYLREDVPHLHIYGQRNYTHRGVGLSTTDAERYTNTY